MLRRQPTRIELKVEDVSEYEKFLAAKARKEEHAAGEDKGAGRAGAAEGANDRKRERRNQRIGLP